MQVIIRSARTGDAEALFELMDALDRETKFMMYEPGERKRDLTRLSTFIQGAVDGNDLLLFAEDGGVIVGYLAAQRGALNRVRHSAYIVAGIRAAYCHHGIGTRFFNMLDDWAKQNGITRLELTVLCANTAAKKLYDKMGFFVEGEKKCSMRVDGVYMDEYYMAKLL